MALAPFLVRQVSGPAIGLDCPIWLVEVKDLILLDGDDLHKESPVAQIPTSRGFLSD